MALFLNEAYEQYTSTGVGTMETFHEAAFALLDLVNQQAALNEGILIADYIIEKQCRNLSEGETTDKIKDFLRKVWHNVKAFAKTVWAKIKEIIALVWRKLREWGSRVLDMFSDKEIEVDRAKLYILEESPRVIEKMISVFNSGIYTSKDKAESFKEKIEGFVKELEKIDNEAEGKNGTEKIGKNLLRHYEKTVAGLAKDLESATITLAKRVTEIEKLVEKLKVDENKEEVQNVINIYRESVKTLVKAGTEVSKTANTVVSIVPEQ